MKAEDWLKRALLVLAGIVGSLLIFFLAKFFVGYQLYAFFMNAAYSVFGLDLALARVLAVGAAVIAILFLPWALSLILFPWRKLQLLLVVVVSTAICSVGLYYGTADVFFDRENGQPVKYYIRTTDGFKFSSQGDFDKTLGAKFKPLTPEIVREYFLWEKTGKFSLVAELKEGEFFDRHTGEAIVWYCERQDKEVFLSPLPGYDQKSGQPLKPVTKEILAHWNDQAAKKKLADEAIAVKEREAQRKREEEEEKEIKKAAAKAEQEAQEAKKREEQQKIEEAEAQEAKEQEEQQEKKRELARQEKIKKLKQKMAVLEEKIKEKEAKKKAEIATAKMGEGVMRVRMIWGVAQSYSKNKLVAAVGVGFPEVALKLMPSYDNKSPVHETGWKGQHTLTSDTLCLEIQDLRLPKTSDLQDFSKNVNPFFSVVEEYKDFGLGYFVQLENAVFEDGQMAKLIFLSRTFLGDSMPINLRKCVKVIPVVETSREDFKIAGDWNFSCEGNNFKARIVQSGNRLKGFYLRTQSSLPVFEGWILGRNMVLAYTQEHRGDVYSVIVPLSSLSKKGNKTEMSGTWHSSHNHTGQWLMEKVEESKVK